MEVSRVLVIQELKIEMGTSAPVLALSSVASRKRMSPESIGNKGHSQPKNYSEGKVRMYL